MPARAIEVWFCGAATTASTSPFSAALIAALANASEARPLSALTAPNSSAAASGVRQASRWVAPLEKSASATRSITRRSPDNPQALA